jgi:hypothetical protein
MSEPEVVEMTQYGFLVVHSTDEMDSKDEVVEPTPNVDDNSAPPTL